MVLKLQIVTKKKNKIHLQFHPQRYVIRASVLNSSVGESRFHWNTAWMAAPEIVQLGA